MRSLLIVMLLASAAHGRQDPPPPEEPAPTEPAPATTSIEDLRKEYERIREAVFSSRARAASVGGALYSTSLELKLRYETGRSWGIRRATIRLDGANVFEDEGGQVSADQAPRFSGFVAPGKHVVTIRIEAQAKDDAKFTYATEDSFVIDAPKDRVVVVDAVASEDGDIAWTFPKKNRGTYRMRLDVNVTAREQKSAK